MPRKAEVRIGKPTGAQLYRKWLAGESFWGIGCDLWWALTERMVEDEIRAYLRELEKRRKRAKANEC